MRKNKRTRRKIKAERLRNKKLLKKYPWLQAIDWWGEPIKTYDMTLLDQMPDGWRKCFGMLMVKDMEKARAGHPIITQQVKEKYGELRWYCTAPREVQNIIDIYTVISRNVCANCGQVDVGYTYSGWIMPICKKCFCHDNYWTDEEYYLQISPYNRMQLEHCYSKVDPETKGWKKYTVDISEYTNKVRTNWYRRHN